jgi:hypothetical protein
MTCAFVGSYTRPVALAFAKQIGQARLHRLVRSMLPRAVWLVCRWHRPQSRGHSSLWVFGFDRPGKSPNSHRSALR